MIFLQLLAGFILQTLPFAYLCFFPCMDQSRFSRRKTIWLSVLFMLALGVLFAAGCIRISSAAQKDMAVIHEVTALNLLMIAACLTWYLHVIRGSLQKKLFLFFFSATIGLLLVLFANSVAAATYYRYHPQILLPFAGSYLPVLAVSEALVIPLLKKMLSSPFITSSMQMEPKEYKDLVRLSSLLFLMFSTSTFFVQKAVIHIPMFSLVCLEMLLCVLAVYYVILQLLQTLHSKMIADEKLRETETRLQLQEQQAGSIKAGMDSARIQRHDLRHHLLILQGFLNSGEYDKADEYLRSMTSTSVGKDEVIVYYCGNPIINMIVSHYKTLAERSGIRYSARISLSNLPLQNADISALLGNLLENALCAAKEAAEDSRFIRIAMVSSGRMLAITVDNGFSGTLKKQNDLYLSTKDHHTGSGLESIRAIAEQYDGAATFSDENSVFHASVMLNMEYDDHSQN